MRRRNTEPKPTAVGQVKSMIASKFPILKWGPRYSYSDLQGDVVAGLTVGLMVVPQSLAYASKLAQLPPKYGLWSSYMGVFIYMFFGTSKDITLGYS